MIIIEFMSPIGHISFNTFFINSMIKQGDCLIIGESLVNEYAQFDPKTFKDLSGSKLARFKNIIRGIFAINKYQKNSRDDLIILSYDIAFIFLLRLLLKGYGQRKIYAFIHNAYPSSIVKKLLLSFVRKRVIFISFSNYLANSIRKIGFNSIVLGLPMLRPTVSDKISCIDKIIEKSKFFEGVIYCASGSTPPNEIENVARKHVSYLIVSKKHFSTKLKNIEFSVDYECYGKMIDFSDYIYIYFPYDNRISGALYDAMAFNKKIIVNKGVFGSYAANLYPNNVGFNIDDLIIKKPYYDCDQYNSELINSIKLIVK